MKRREHVECIWPRGEISLSHHSENDLDNAIRKIHNEHGNETGVSPPPTETPGGRRAGVHASCNSLCVFDALAAGTVPTGGLENVRHICQRTPLYTVEGIFSIRFISRNYMRVRGWNLVVFIVRLLCFFEMVRQIAGLIVSAHTAFFFFVGLIYGGHKLLF